MKGLEEKIMKKIEEMRADLMKDLVGEMKKGGKTVKEIAEALEVTQTEVKKYYRKKK
jgi:predicted transcriptional regulator